MERSVLVTGGARGIGLAVAQTLAAQGHRVAVTHRTSVPPEGFLAVKCDVTDPTAVDEAFNAVEAAQGPVEVLVANAGMTRDKLLVQMSDEDFAAPLAANLNGAFLVARRAVRKMMTARFGRLIFVSSVVALRGEVGQANYAASKAGLIGLARSLAREYGGAQITSNVIAPGLTETDMISSLTERRLTEMVKQIPLRRTAQPQDIAAAVAFLASDAAGYITGAILPVDGGVSMGL